MQATEQYALLHPGQYEEVRSSPLAPRHGTINAAYGTTSSRNENRSNESALRAFEDIEDAITVTWLERLKKWGANFYHLYIFKPKMTTRDRLLMSPWEKWNKYNRFPIKSIIHTFIVMVTVTQILLLVSEFSSYSLETNATFQHLFSPSTEEGIYTIGDCVEAINETLITYASFSTDSVDRYLHLEDDAGGGKHIHVPADDPVPMIVTRYATSFYNRSSGQYIFANFDDLSTTTEDYQVYAGNLGPLSASGEELRSFFYSLVQIRLEMEVENLAIGLFGAIPFIWDITITYDFTGGGGLVDYDVDSSKKVTNHHDIDTLRIFLYLNVGNLLLNLLSLYLSAKALLDSFKVYRMTQLKYDKKVRSPKMLLLAAKAVKDKPKATRMLLHYGTWAKVPWSVRVQFFNLWNLWMIIGDILLITSSILGLLFDKGIGEELLFYLVLGFGGFFVCVNLTRYLEYSVYFYTLILTLRMSFFRVACFIVSVVPIFLGYALIGVLLFSQYSADFQSLDTTCATLFALLNGDSILAVFEELYEDFPLPYVSRVYLYTFEALFITAILNIFIFIIEDSYHAAKAWGKKSKNSDDNDNIPSFNIRKLFDVMELKKKQRKKRRRLRRKLREEQQQMTEEETAWDKKDEAPEDLMTDSTLRLGQITRISTKRQFALPQQARAVSGVLPQTTSRQLLSSSSSSSSSTTSDGSSSSTSDDELAASTRSGREEEKRQRKATEDGVMEEEQEVGRNTPEEKKGKATKRDDTIDVELASEFDIGFRFPPKAKGSAPKMDGDESQGVGKHQKREQVADSWNREKRRRELTQTTRTHDFEISDDDDNGDDEDDDEDDDFSIGFGYSSSEEGSFLSQRREDDDEEGMDFAGALAEFDRADDDIASDTSEERDIRLRKEIGEMIEDSRQQTLHEMKDLLRTMLMELTGAPGQSVVGRPSSSPAVSARHTFGGGQEASSSDEGISTRTRFYGGSPGSTSAALPQRHQSSDTGTRRRGGSIPPPSNFSSSSPRGTGF